MPGGEHPQGAPDNASAWGRPAGVTTAVGSALGSNLPLACERAGTCPPTEMSPLYLRASTGAPAGTTIHRPGRPAPTRWGGVRMGTGGETEAQSQEVIAWMV